MNSGCMNSLGSLVAGMQDDLGNTGGLLDLFRGVKLVHSGHHAHEVGVSVGDALGRRQDPGVAEDASPAGVMVSSEVVDLNGNLVRKLAPVSVNSANDSRTRVVG